MARIFSFRPALTLRGRGFKGIRGWAGKPTHPPLTDIPVTAYVLTAIFDVISFAARGHPGIAHDFFIAATFVLIAGAATSLATATTGFWDWWKGVDREPPGPIGRAHHTQVWRTMNAHMAIMLTVTAVVVVDVVVRLVQLSVHRASVVVMILSIVAGLLVAVGATYGGSLVFDYQFNVESLEGSTVWDETETDQLPSDKPQSGW